jgi:NADPH2 dehydrogenase
MKTHLFSPYRLGPLELANRIVVSPMCQYSAINGTMTDWHLMHLGQFAVSGAALVFVEATSVEPEGRITPGCTGLWSDENEAAMGRVVQFYQDYGSARIGIQIGHAGRKASSNVPWRGGKSLTPEQGAWQTIAPSAIPLGPDWHTPEAMTGQTLRRVREAFVASTKRALRLDFDVLEIHGAHGYLLHSFLSPLANRRDDKYGGSLENRMRYPLEVFDAVREVWPADRPLGVRFSASDWLDGGWDVESSIVFTEELKAHGCDFVDVSSGSLSPEQKLVTGPGYQTQFAAEVRRATGIPTMSVGQITDPIQAETIVRTGQADMVSLARAMLFNPHWPWQAAIALQDRTAFPPQYQRAHAALLNEQVVEPPALAST